MKKTRRSQTEKTADRREAILNAMLDLINERGFHDAPMSELARRSGASTGVIYHHFSGKDEIIAALYQHVSGKKMHSFLDDYSPEGDAHEEFLRAWKNIYRFYRDYPREARFLEQFEATGIACNYEMSEELAQKAHLFANRYRSHTRGGVLGNLPDELLFEMTLGVVQRLAKQQLRIGPKMLAELAERSWTFVKA